MWCIAFISDCFYVNWLAMCPVTFSAKFFIACSKYILQKRIVKMSAEQEQVLFESPPYTTFLQLSQWLFTSPSIMPILSRTIFRTSAPFPYTFVGANNFRASPECHHTHISICFHLMMFSRTNYNWFWLFIAPAPLSLFWSFQSISIAIVAW